MSAGPATSPRYTPQANRRGMSWAASIPATSPGPDTSLWKPCRIKSPPTKRRSRSLPASSVDQFMGPPLARRSVEQAPPVGHAVVVDELDAQHVAGFRLGGRDPAGHAREVEGAVLAFQVDGDLHLLAQGEGLLGLDLDAAGGDVHGGAVILGHGDVFAADVQLADDGTLFLAQTGVSAPVLGITHLGSHQRIRDYLLLWGALIVPYKYRADSLGHAAYIMEYPAADAAHSRG